MATQNEGELLEDEVASEEEAPPVEGGFFSNIGAMGQAPWWAVSVALHVLCILLASLVTMTIGEVLNDQTVIVTTSLEKKIEYTEAERPAATSKFVLEGKHDTPPTDPNATNPSDIVVPPDIMAKAELGDHFETINPDRPDTHSAFGNPEAHMFHSVSGNDDAAGGGGTGGVGLDDVIGINGVGSMGTGGGQGGGHGTGTGVDTGAGHGSYGQRGDGGRKLMVPRHGGSRATEGAVEAALRWLAKNQEVDGHWDCVKHGGKQADVAVTGLALLAFLGAGHHEKVGQYKDNVKRAIYWLISIQNDDGKYYKNGETHGVGYHHAIAGLAMAEAAGMGRVGETQKSAQRGIDYSVDKHQQGEGSEKRGWRYAAKTAVADISVGGWFIMQYKSAKVASLKVDPAGFDGGIKFLDSVEQKGAAGDPYGGHRYGYTDANSIGHRRCAIGCLGRQFLGVKREELQGGVEHFVQQGGTPKWDGNGSSVDLYYWYYATLCVFQQGGDLWKRWNEDLKKALVENQRKGNDNESGSWDPVGSYSEYWGRAGQTALGALCLEVYYRYLPLYK